jgi:hypothetical protein
MKKVLLMGLEDTGKTAIIEILKHKKIENIKYILPTRGCRIEEIKFNNQVFYVWELAGPSKYRIRWIEEKDRIFTLINEMIYFINVQNVETYEESVNYLAQLLNVFNSGFNGFIDTNFKLFILFHKSDPNMVNLREFLDNSTLLTNKIKKLNILFTYEIWKTSIYNFQGNFYESFLTNDNISYFGTLLARIFSS